MHDQISLLLRAEPAQRTLVGECFHVRQLVLLQTLGVVELFVALVAGEVALVHVNQLVTSEVVPVAKLFIAKRALELYRTVVVDTLVVVQRYVCFEPFRAGRAGEVPITRVNSGHVVVQQSLIAKFFTTVRAGEVFYVQMNLVDVVRVRTPVGQRLLADVAVQLPNVTGLCFSRLSCRRLRTLFIVLFVGDLRPAAGLTFGRLLTTFALLQIDSGCLLLLVVLVLRRDRL